MAKKKGKKKISKKRMGKLYLHYLDFASYLWKSSIPRCYIVFYFLKF